MDAPRAEKVMVEWLHQKGWKVSLSGPGRIATRLFQQLGGSFGTDWLGHPGMIKLLASLETEGGLPRHTLVARLNQVLAKQSPRLDAARMIDRLVTSNAVRLGAKVQCPTCTRHNWFELTKLDYNLDCSFCLSEFKAPSSQPGDMQWTYRAHGPFASSVAQGSFTVLLTLNFLSGPFHDRGVTPLFSYHAAKGKRELEADMTCLYRPSLWRDSPLRVLHVECKSFNRFEQRDIQRMRYLAEAFPGSALVFSTLNERLGRVEQTLLARLTTTERRKRLARKPYSAVIVLTGVELCSFGIQDCWKERGGLYDELTSGHVDYGDLDELADATQRLYLNLPSFSATNSG